MLGWQTTEIVMTTITMPREHKTGNSTRDYSDWVDMTTNTHFANEEQRTNKQHSGCTESTEDWCWHDNEHCTRRKRWRWCWHDNEHTLCRRGTKNQQAARWTRRKRWRSMSTQQRTLHRKKALKMMLTWQQTHTLQMRNKEPASSMVDAQKALKIDVNMTTNTHFADEERRTSKQHGVQKALKIGVDMTMNIAHYALQMRNQQTNKHGGQRADNKNMNMCQNRLADRKKKRIFWSTTMNDTKELKFPSTKHGTSTKKKTNNNEDLLKFRVQQRTIPKNWSFNEDLLKFRVHETCQKRVRKMNHNEDLLKFRGRLKFQSTKHGTSRKKNEPYWRPTEVSRWIRMRANYNRMNSFGSLERSSNHEVSKRKERWTPQWSVESDEHPNEVAKVMNTPTKHQKWWTQPNEDPSAGKIKDGINKWTNNTTDFF